ncbi:MAG TPA: hypothetical protein VHV78_18645, partial [Gemmatimonadaceae bacterium]|nr:hypothetical protein [Gemmatimonadaceae bacterium]
TRPGEKLYEELFFGPDDATPTTHPKILRSRDGRPSIDIHRSIDGLIAAATRREPILELRRMMRALVPEYSHASLNRSTELPVVAAPLGRTSATEALVARVSADRGLHVED